MLTILYYLFIVIFISYFIIKYIYYYSTYLFTQVRHGMIDKYICQKTP